MKRKLMATILAASMIAVMGAGVYADSAVESAASGAESAEEAIDTTNHTGKHFKFGYTCMDGTNPFFVTIQNEMKEKIEANGDTLVITDPGNDSSKQISQVEDRLSQNLDGLFVNPVDAKGILPALDEAKADKAVSLMYRYLNGEKLEDTYPVDTCLITADNVDQYGTDGWQ